MLEDLQRKDSELIMIKLSTKESDSKLRKLSEHLEKMKSSKNFYKDAFD